MIHVLNVKFIHLSRLNLKFIIKFQFENRLNKLIDRKSVKFCLIKGYLEVIKFYQKFQILSLQRMVTFRYSKKVLKKKSPIFTG